MAEIYRAHGVPLPGAEPYEKGALAGKALVVAAFLPRAPDGDSLKARRVILVSGWALLDASYDRFDATVSVRSPTTRTGTSSSASWSSPASAAFHEPTLSPAALARVLTEAGLDAEPLRSSRAKRNETDGNEPDGNEPDARRKASTAGSSARAVRAPQDASGMTGSMLRFADLCARLRARARLPRRCPCGATSRRSTTRACRSLRGS